MKQEIATIENQYPAIRGLDIIKGNLAYGECFDTRDLQRIPWPSGGALVFEGVPGGSPTGVIIAQRVTREMYPRSFDESGGKDRPYCSSDNGINGQLNYGDGDNVSLRKEIAEQGRPTGECRTCQFARFIVKNGRNIMLCSERRELVMIAHGFNMPIRLSIPPSSVGITKKFLINLCRPLNSVVVSIGLQKAQSKSGIKYSEAVFSVEKVLEGDEQKRIAEFTQEFAAIL